MYYSKGDYGAAVAQFSKVVRAQPDLLPGQLFLGLSELNLGRPRNGEVALQNALRLDPANSQAKLALLKACIDQGKYREAGAQLDLLRAQPPEEEMLYAVGQAYFDMGKELTSRMAEQYPSSPWAH